MKRNGNSAPANTGPLPFVANCEIAGACMTGRAIAQVMRLACLYAVLDRDGQVRSEHLTAALSLWEYAEQSVRFIFGDSLGDPVADDILRGLRKVTSGMTREEIRDYFARHRSAAEIGRAGPGRRDAAAALRRAPGRCFRGDGSRGHRSRRRFPARTA